MKEEGAWEIASAKEKIYEMCLKTTEAWYGRHAVENIERPGKSRRNGGEGDREPHPGSVGNKSPNFKAKSQTLGAGIT